VTRRTCGCRNIAGAGGARSGEIPGTGAASARATVRICCETAAACSCRSVCRTVVDDDQLRASPCALRDTCSTWTGRRARTSRSGGTFASRRPTHASTRPGRSRDRRDDQMCSRRTAGRHLPRTRGTTAGCNVSCGSSGTGFLVDPRVQTRDLVDPAAAVDVLELEELVRRPVEVVGHERYLLDEEIEGVAANPPRLFTSASNSCSHCGHTTCSRSGSTALIRL